MVRRSFGFIVTIALVGWAGYQLAWNQNIVDDLGGVGFFGILLAFGAVAGLLFWKVNRVTMVLAVILGAVGANVLDDVMDNITWSGVWKAALALLLLFILWLVTVADMAWIRRVKTAALNKLPSPPVRSAQSDDRDIQAPRRVV